MLFFRGFDRGSQLLRSSPKRKEERKGKEKSGRNGNELPSRQKFYCTEIIFSIHVILWVRRYLLS